MHVLVCLCGLLQFHRYCAAAEESSSTSSIDLDLHNKKELLTENVNQNLRRIDQCNRDILRRCGAQLIQLLYFDAVDGRVSTRIIAFGVLETIIDFDDTGGEWLEYMKRRNFLRQIIDDIKNNDPQLRAALQPRPPDINSLWIYEHKMSFLLRVATSRTGAMCIVADGVVDRLTKCTFIDMRPEGYVATDEMPYDDIIASNYLDQVPRYSTLLQHALSLMVALLTSLPDNRDLHAHVAEFIKVHFDVFRAILKDRSYITLTSLRDLQLITEILFLLSRSSSYDTAAEILGANFDEIRRLNLNLLVKYCYPYWRNYLRVRTKQVSKGFSAS